MSKVKLHETFIQSIISAPTKSARAKILRSASEEQILSILELIINASENTEFVGTISDKTQKLQLRKLTSWFPMKRRKRISVHRTSSIVIFFTFKILGIYRESIIGTMQTYKVLPIGLYEILIQRATTSELEQYKWVEKAHHTAGKKHKINSAEKAWITVEKRFKLSN